MLEDSKIAEEPALIDTVTDDAAPPAKPVSRSDRAIAIDVLRGVAVFGILFVNIESFSMITQGRRNPSFGGGEGLDNYLVWLNTMLFADTKFIALFGMLFGAGVVIMRKRWKLAGRRPGPIFLRRMLTLIIFGLLHGFLLWDGDILFYYGLFGLFLFPLVEIPGHWLVLTGITFIFLKGVRFGWPALPPDFGIGQFPYEDRTVEYQALTSDWLGQFEWRRHETYRTFKMGSIYFALQGFGYMLIGMGLVKGGVLGGHRRQSTYIIMMVLGFAIGLPLIVVPSDWCSDFSGWGGPMFVLGSLFVSFAWMGTTIAAAKAWPRFFLTRAFANVGRMALTNYLTHTVICTTIFYGHGYSQFTLWERAEQVQLVLAICFGQLIFSSLWFLLFRFGPMEWLWRSITYWRIQPILRSRDAS